MRGSPKTKTKKGTRGPAQTPGLNRSLAQVPELSERRPNLPKGGSTIAEPPRGVGFTPLSNARGSLRSSPFGGTTRSLGLRSNLFEGPIKWSYPRLDNQGCWSNLCEVRPIWNPVNRASGRLDQVPLILNRTDRI